MTVALLMIGFVMSDRQILDALALLPRDAYASRDKLCDVWFSPTRPKPVKDYRFGDFNFI